MKEITKKIKLTNGSGDTTSMTLRWSNEKKVIEFNGNTYQSINPGEMLTDEHIKNPQPLPDNTYAFKVDGNILVVTKSRLHGLVITSLNPSYAVSYPGKNTFDNVIKGIFIGAVILIIVLIITMGW